MNENKNELFLKHERLIYLALKHLKINYKQEEYYEEGMIGLTKAINTYDKNKDIKESTYFYKCIYNQILKYIKYQNREKRKKEKCISLDKEISENFCIGDFIPDNKINFENEIEQEDFENYVYDLILKLDFDDQYLLFNYFNFQTNSKNIKEIAKEYGISSQAIYQKLSNALNKLKRKMKGDYYGNKR